MKNENTSKLANSIGHSGHSLAGVFYQSGPAHGFAALRTTAATSRQSGGHHPHTVFTCRSAPSHRQFRSAFRSADRIVVIQPQTDVQGALDHYFSRRWIGLAFGQKWHHSYRCQRDYFRPDRLFNQFGHISPGLESIDHLAGGTFIIWRCFAISVHICAGH